MYSESEIRTSVRRLKFNGPPIAEAERLSFRLLNDLRQRKICAIYIKNFTPRQVIRSAWRKLVDETPAELGPIIDYRGNYSKTDTSFMITTPIVGAQLHRKTLQKYLKTAESNMATVRAAFSPFLSPIDRLRVEVDELWPQGSSIGKVQEKNGFAGIVRVIRHEDLYAGAGGKLGICHADSPPNVTTWGASIYMHMPKLGGELKIWSLKFSGAAMTSPVLRLIQTSAFDEANQDLLHSILPKPLILRPQIGDLVILDTAYPHAVSGFGGGVRASIHSFMYMMPETRHIRFLS